MIRRTAVKAVYSNGLIGKVGASTRSLFTAKFSQG